jgi:hypothetical protein
MDPTAVASMVAAVVGVILWRIVDGDRAHRNSPGVLDEIPHL